MNRTHHRVAEPADTLLTQLPYHGEFAALGDVLLVERIGEGGMGRVYLGFDHRLERWVAAKLRRPADERDAERFRQEGVALAGITSEHLVQVFSHGEAGDVHFLVMEFVNGEDLNRRMDRHGGRLELGDALAILLAATSGVAEAHRRRIWHRDIKPGNILVAASGAVKVADLGIAKLTRPGAIGLTLEDTVMGTVGYMAPELFRGAQHAGPASDVFALGATLASLLVGKSVIAPDTRGDVHEAIAKANAFPNLAEFGVHLPPTIAELLAKATAAEPTARYRDADELLVHLRRATAAMTLRSLADPGAERFRAGHLSMLRIQVDACLEMPVRMPDPSAHRVKSTVRDVVPPMPAPAPTPAPQPTRTGVKVALAAAAVALVAVVLALTRNGTPPPATTNHAEMAQPANPPTLAGRPAAVRDATAEPTAAAPVPAIAAAPSTPPATAPRLAVPPELRLDAGSDHLLAVELQPTTAALTAMVRDGALQLELRPVAGSPRQYQLRALPGKQDTTATVVWTAGTGDAMTEAQTTVRIRGIDRPPQAMAAEPAGTDAALVTEARAGTTLSVRARISDPDDAPESVPCRCLLDGQVVATKPAAPDGTVEFAVALPAAPLGARTVTIEVGEGRADQQVARAIQVLPAVAADSIAFAIDPTHLEATDELPFLRSFFTRHFRALGLPLVDDPATAAYTLELFVGPAPSRPEVAHAFLRLRRNLDRQDVGVPFRVGLANGTENPEPASRLRAAWKTTIERARYQDQPGRTWPELVPEIRDRVARDLANPTSRPR